MRETGRERGRFYDVVYEFADLPDAGVDAGVFAVVVQQAGVSLLDEDHATGRRPHYVVVFGEERFHPLGQGLGVTLVARIGHRLAATGLIEGIIYLYAQLREQLVRGFAHLGIERVDVTGNEKSNFHRSCVFRSCLPKKQQTGFQS